MPATLPSSPIDVLDASGRPIGVTPRAEALQRGMAVRTVHVFVLDAAGRLLIQQLGRERGRHPLLWGSSAAGFPRPGEDEHEAAERRLREEVSVTAPVNVVGRTRMLDGLSTKFVTLFEAHADHASIAEPDHIERIEFRDTGELGAEVVEHPAAFTETFRHVFSFWLEQRREPGA